jgi:hypothetical protein
MDSLASLVKAAEGEDVAAALRAVSALRRRLEELEELQVKQALERNWSWQQIGEALGISRQAAHKKHARWFRG